MQSSVAMMTPSIHTSTSPSIHSFGKSFIKTQHIASESSLPRGTVATMTIMQKKLLVEETATPKPTSFVAPPPTETTKITTPSPFSSQYDIPGGDNGMNVASKLSQPSPLKKKKMGTTRNQVEWPLFLACPDPTPIVLEDGAVLASTGRRNDGSVLNLGWRLGELPSLASTTNTPPGDAPLAASEAKPAEDEVNHGLDGSGMACLDNSSPATPTVHHARSFPFLESRDDKDGAKHITISNSHRHPSSPITSSHSGTFLEIHSSLSCEASPDISLSKLGPEALSSSTTGDVMCFPHLPSNVKTHKDDSKSLEAISVASISSSLPSKDVLLSEDDDDTQTAVIAVEIEWELADEKDGICHFLDKNDDEEWSFSTASNATFKAFDDLSDLTSRTESERDDDEESNEGEDVDSESIPQIAYDNSDNCDSDDDIHVRETEATTVETSGRGALQDRSLLDFLSNLCEGIPT